MTIMNRPRLRCLYVAFVAMACAVMPVTPAIAGATATRGMSGSATSVCGLGTQSRAIEFSVSGSTGSKVASVKIDGVSTSSASITIFCNVTSTLKISAPTSIQGVKTLDYTLSLKNGVTTVSTIASPVTNSVIRLSSPVNVTTISIDSESLANNQNNGLYNATVTLTLTAG